MHETPQASREMPQSIAWPQGLRQILPEILLIALAAYLWYRTGVFRQVPAGDLGPDFWPQILTALIALTAFVRLVHKVLLLRRANRSAQAPVGDQNVGEPAGEEDEEPIFRDKAAIVMALSVGYVLGVIYFGYPLATAIFLAAFLWLAGKRNLLTVLAVSLVGAFVFAYTFQKIVFVALPTGVGIFDAFTVWLYRLTGIY